MSKRLQVLFDEDELTEIQQIAEKERMTVAEWVRQTLRAARERRFVAEPNRKLLAVQEAAAIYAFPVNGIVEMNAEIVAGYSARHELP